VEETCSLANSSISGLSTTVSPAAGGSCGGQSSGFCCFGRIANFVDTGLRTISTLTNKESLSSRPTGKLFLNMDAEEQLHEAEDFVQNSEESFREAEASAGEAEASARLNCAPAARQLRKGFRAGPPMARA
jgi:hypothetical protein